ncbi:hypothetical protein [Pseudomonas sp. JQ36]
MNAGGIKAVDNIHYCTPAELEDSGEFSEVQNAVKKATPEEMKHATSGKLHPKHQKATVEWIKKAKKLLKPNNNKVQTSGDIFQAILDTKNLKLDRAVAKAMIESGYTDNYNDDKEINTYRYDAEEFSTRLKNGDISIEEEVRKEISIFRLQMKNIKISRQNVNITLGTYRTLKLEYEICKNILETVKNRMDILIEACETNKIFSPSIDIAKRISNEIESEIIQKTE